MTEDAEDKSKIIDRVRKLLALASNNTSIEESAAAAAKAQALMEKYAIIDAMVAGERQDADPTITSKVIWTGGKVPTWILQLSMGLAEVNRCKIWYHAGRRSKGYNGYIKAAGTEESLAKMSVLLDWLIGEVNRLYIEDKPGIFNRGDGKKWANAFRLGASSTIVARLTEAAKQARLEMQQGGPSSEAYRIALETADIEALMRLDAQRINRTVYLPAQVQTALVRLDNEVKLVAGWMSKNLKLNKGTPRNFQGSYEAGYRSGRKAGERADLHGPHDDGEE